MTTLDDKNDDIQIIEEEEEVLVDDFDGQCCRTFPYNHSKIQRWREERRKRGEERRVKEAKREQDHREITKHLEAVPSSSIETGVSEPLTTSAGQSVNFSHHSFNRGLRG